MAEVEIVIVCDERMKTALYKGGVLQNRVDSNDGYEVARLSEGGACKVRTRNPVDWTADPWPDYLLDIPGEGPDKIPYGWRRTGVGILSAGDYYVAGLDVLRASHNQKDFPRVLVEKVDVGEGYEMVGENDIILNGDECTLSNPPSFWPCGAIWTPCGFSVGKTPAEHNGYGCSVSDICVRRKKKPVYRPFTMDEFLPHSDRWIRVKSTGVLRRASSIDSSHLFFLRVHASWPELLEHYEFSDGSPCGVLA